MKQKKRHKPPPQRRINVCFRMPETPEKTADAAGHCPSCERARAEQVVLMTSPKSMSVASRQRPERSSKEDIFGIVTRLSE
jgi:hypothetical protein